MATAVGIKDCVSCIMTLARGEGTLQQKMHNAESRISDFLLDANPEVAGWFEILEDLLGRLKTEIKFHQGSTGEFLIKVIDFLDGHLDRASAKPDDICVSEQRPAPDSGLGSDIARRRFGVNFGRNSISALRPPIP